MSRRERRIHAEESRPKEVALLYFNVTNFGPAPLGLALCYKLTAGREDLKILFLKFFI